MAHEIDFSTGKAAIAYARQTPWHGLGTQFDDLMTSEQALNAACLNYTVTKEQACYEDKNGIVHPCPGRYVTARSDTGTGLGTVGEGYKVIQNIEAFDFMDSLIESGDIRYEVAGALRGGSVVWMLAKLPEQTAVSHDDVSEHYLLLSNSHDGSRACSVAFTTVRVVCANTLRLAASQGLKHEVKIRHSGSVKDKIEEARQILGLAKDSFDLFGKQARALSFKEYRTQEEVNKFLYQVLGVKGPDDITKPAQASIESIKELIETGAGTDLPGVKGTYWGLVNAVTEFADHNRPQRDRGRSLDESRFEAVTWGGGNTLKQRAFEAALAAV